MIVIFSESIVFANAPSVMPGRPVEMEDEADAQRFIKAGIAVEAHKGSVPTATVPKQRAPKPRKPETAAVTPQAETAVTPNPAASNPVAVVALAAVQVNEERFKKGEAFLVEPVLAASLIEDKKVKLATKAQAKKATRTADGN